MKVIVVGGGIIGASCAWALARRGATVELVDAGDPPGGGASVRSDGGLLLFNKKAEALHLAMRALDAWERAAPALGEIEYEDNDLLMVARDAVEETALRERATTLAGAGLTVEEFSGDECRSLEPGLGPSVRYGFRVRENRAVQPMLATVALLRAARMAGTVVTRNADVRAVLPGRVRTDDGREFTADEVVVAAGSWTGRLLASTGVSVPVEPRRGHVLVAERASSRLVRTGAMGAAYATVAHSSDAGLHVVPLVTPTRSGTVLIGASRERAGFGVTVNADTFKALCAGAVSLYPGLRSCRVIRSWVGLRPWTPDGYPYVGRLCPGLNVAAGHEGEGITYAPLTGAVIADLLVAAVPVPAEWSPDRFRHGAGGAVTASVPKA